MELRSRSLVNLCPSNLVVRSSTSSQVQGKAMSTSNGSSYTTPKVYLNTVGLNSQHAQYQSPHSRDGFMEGSPKLAEGSPRVRSHFANTSSFDDDGTSLDADVHMLRQKNQEMARQMELLQQQMANMSGAGNRVQQQRGYQYVPDCRGGQPQFYGPDRDYQEFDRPRRYHHHPPLDRPYRDEPRVELPKFNGRTGWQAFWIQFQMVARRYMWEEETKCENLILCLVDDAIDYVSQLREDTLYDYQALVEALQRRFGDRTLAATHRAKLSTLTKNANESMQQYASRVTRAVSRAFPGIDDTPLSTQLSIEYMMKGLPDTELAYDVLTKKPQTIEEALDMVAWHECCKPKPRSIRNLHTEYPFEQVEADPVEVRRINDKRFVTEERLQQFGRELKDGIVNALGGPKSGADSKKGDAPRQRLPEKLSQKEFISVDVPGNDVGSSQ